jgi:membrane protein
MHAPLSHLSVHGPVLLSVLGPILLPVLRRVLVPVLGPVLLPVLGRLLDGITVFVRKFANDWSMNLASMLAFNLITTIFPILLLILSIAGMVLHALFVAHHTSDLSAAISARLPLELQRDIDVNGLLRSLIEITGPLAVVSLVTLLWIGSNLFTTMENVFSIIFRTPGRHIVAQRLRALAMVLVLAALLPTSLGAASLVTAGSAEFKRFLPWPLGPVLSIVGPLTSLAVLWVLFLVIYMVVPPVRVRFRDAWPGALAAAILFGIFEVIFPLYFTVFMHGNTRYGAAGAAILVLIVWLWIFALVTVLGAQINAVAMGLEPLPCGLDRVFARAYTHMVRADAGATDEQPPAAG